MNILNLFYSAVLLTATSFITGCISSPSVSDAPTFQCNNLDVYTATKVSQPDYKQWNDVLAGMTKNEVATLLGKPIYISEGGSSDVWHYGCIYPELPLVFKSYSFRIIFSDDIVGAKFDPFLGVFSKDGLPSKPLHISPSDGAVFSHYPSIIDFRWQPVSGVYPMSYEFEMGDSTKRKRKYPFVTIDLLPLNKYVWRIRGVNAKGKGEWSSWRSFEFRNKYRVQP